MSSRCLSRHVDMRVQRPVRSTPTARCPLPAPTFWVETRRPQDALKIQRRPSRPDWLAPTVASVPNRRAALSLAIAVVMALTGCAKNASTTTATATAPAAPSVGPPSLPVAAVTAPSTTTTAEAPPTNAAPSVTASTPTAPPATAKPEPLEQIISKAAVRNMMVEGAACFDDPDQCDPTTFSASTGSARANSLSNLKDFRDHNYRTRTNTEDPDYLVVTDVTVADDHQNAVVLACYWDTGIIFQPKAAPDGSDIMVSTSKETAYFRFEMVPERGTWFIASSAITRHAPKENLCGPKH